MDRASHRVCSIRSRYLFRLHVNFYIHGDCVSPDRGIRHGGEQRDALDVRSCVSSVYDSRLGYVGSTALLAGLTTILAPLP